ncbi:MAG TPA: hypothetical protein PLP50_00915 [Thermoanaerobaculia bacterium]|nr:hypothetical protein [Thermoanaerobaculia bacterium]HQN08694.1 hypothetical protein [Thermoanaerobaculia bacterium]HQP85077.1 hypothetical protein [Thermoanaerobaculia bacterium]
MTETSIPETLANLAANVAAQHDEMTAAVEEERAAEERLLGQLVEAVRPALRALSSRLLASERTFWPDNVSTATEKDYHDERGVRLAGSGPERDHPRANDGGIEGTDLVLLEDGTFARLDWSGSWSRWQGAASHEDSALTRISLRDVVDGWDVDQLAAALHERLEAQMAGRAPKRTASARERAEKLRAVSSLLGARS